MKICLTLLILTFSAFGQSWSLDRINQRSLPLDGDVSISGTGQGVRVYVVDSGIMLEHPQFEGRAIKGYGRPEKGCTGHGTGVAGIIGSKDYGVAKNVTLVSVQVFCAGGVQITDIIKGLAWVKRDCRQQRTRCVANISLISGKYLDFNTAVQDLIDSGIVVVVGAGNNGADACNYSPASVPDAIAVGASRIDDTTVSYSNFGACVDIYAPGEAVWTIWNDASFTPLQVSGTSFSAPHVAGAAAIYLEQHPSATPQEVNAGIIGHATYNVLISANPNIFLYSNF